MSYTCDVKELTGYTTTWKPPTKEEDERKIIDLAKRIQKKKWYESKKGLRDEMWYCAYRLNNLHK